MHLIVAGLALLGGCNTEESAAPRPTVFFAMDAPLCSSIIPVQFFIDSVMVGADTFVVGLSPEHTRSHGFTTSPGRHIVGARGLTGYLWPDTVISLAAGGVFTDSLPFYCS